MSSDVTCPVQMFKMHWENRSCPTYVGHLLTKVGDPFVWGLLPGAAFCNSSVHEADAAGDPRDRPPTVPTPGVALGAEPSITSATRTVLNGFCSDITTSKLPLHCHILTAMGDRVSHQWERSVFCVWFTLLDPKIEK